MIAHSVDLRSSVVHGAQETTASAMARFFSLMTVDPCLQQRVREELIEAKKVRSRPFMFVDMGLKCPQRKGAGEDLDFYELNNLPLLDAVCRETLRLYTPVTFVWRQ
jgi:cytochrome P450